MAFETKQIDRKYRIVKQYFLNKDNFDLKYWISDTRIGTPYHFNCPKCQLSSTDIDHLNCTAFNTSNFILDLNQVIELGGTGLIYKIIECRECNTKYYMGIGYMEPNNGRDVYMIHTILEVE